MKKNVLVMISPFSAMRVAGVARYAREHGWHLMIQDRLGHRPLAWNGDGVVAALRSDATSVATILKIKKRGIPVVDITMSRPDINVPRVTSDHIGIGRLAAEHFAERNFRNIVWFSTGWGNVHALRYGGLAEKTPAARWIAEESLPKARRNDWAAFMRWIGRKLKEAPKPLAALSYDEADAARLLDAAERVGVSVPEELAILSIGNDPIICENQSVPLSSIDQNLETGGYEAAALLDRLMNGEAAPKAPVLIPPNGICLRRSTDIIASSDPVVKKTLDYIAANLARPFGAAQIADALGISRNILDKRFHADLNRSIGTEIMRQRIALVKLLLRNTDKTMAEIAKCAGFCTPSHLSNTFRAATGSTLRAWRAGCA
ncbi:MAG: substrate-binding domain-containing protein [Kiritimatiellae bacterium]|nr:substrate-binding domain-containing protein [Kiritimatiellia bacterium]